MKLMMIDIPDKIYDTIQDDQVITREQLLVLQNCILRGSLMSRVIKYRAKHFVAYNDDWLKENWEMEMKLLGVDFSKHDAELLDKIRAEIEQYQADCDLSCSDDSNCRTCNNITFGTIYQIIDKYRKGKE